MTEEPRSEDARITGLRRGRLVLLVGLAIVAVVILTWAIVKSRAQKTSSQAAQSAANAGSAPTPTEVVTSVVSQDLNRQARLPSALQRS